jgi:hypothetical protein
MRSTSICTPAHLWYDMTYVDMYSCAARLYAPQHTFAYDMAEHDVPSHSQDLDSRSARMPVIETAGTATTAFLRSHRTCGYCLLVC